MDDIKKILANANIVITSEWTPLAGEKNGARVARGEIQSIELAECGVVLVIAYPDAVKPCITVYKMINHI